MNYIQLFLECNGTQARRFAYQLLKNGYKPSRLGEFNTWFKGGFGPTKGIAVIGDKFQFTNHLASSITQCRFNNKNRREALRACVSANH